MNKTLIILNPWAGRGAAGERRRDIEWALARAGLSYDLWTTHARGGATELAWQGVNRGYPRVVAVGGDGTINEVVNGIKGAEAESGQRAQLGIIPFGTGSDFVKILDGFQLNDVVGGIRRIAEVHPRTIDLGSVRIGDNEPRFFINALGIGFDAHVAAESLKLTRLRGLAVYLVAILRGLVTYRAHPMTVEYNAHKIHRRLLFTSIANGRCQAGGFWLTPDALIDDGLFDLCLVDNMRLDEIIRHIPKVMEGTHTHLKQVTMGRTNKIRIECSAPMPVQADGEVLSTDARLIQAEMIPNALEVLI
ncbi:MAG: diacylglycerol kinase family lipid kinase [Roseiflexaceae bacterium]|nr:diacylglycerol kinase family lipid kinase [Roseiflexaceae bacterium]